jgi:CheY-like chemotaxis protein
VTVTLTVAGRSAGGETGISFSEMNALVIDDDRIACEHAEVELRQAGISCETALSGKQGVELVQMRHARRRDYDLILVDWKMPETDGIETVKQLRGIIGSDTPIIMLTSHNRDDVEAEAEAAGADSFVSKPLFAATFTEELRAIFRKKRRASRKRTADLRGRRILLAEDVAINAEIMKKVLSMKDIQVEHAENGRLAVEMFAGHEPGRYDAILMDMRMPEMDGLEATRTIRAMDRKDAGRIPIIALTANAFDEDVQRSLQAGLNAHLSKPVEPEILYETLQSMIRDDAGEK